MTRSRRPDKPAPAPTDEFERIVANVVAASEVTQFDQRFTEALRTAERQDIVHQLFIATGERLLIADDPGRMALPWLRRLASVSKRWTGDEAFFAQLSAAAQKVLHRVLTEYQSQVRAVESAFLGQLGAIEFARGQPTAAAVARELGDILQRLRGTGFAALVDRSELVTLARFREALQATPQESRTLSPEWMRVTRDQLLQWVRTDPSASYTLPVLVRRLIAETASDLKDLQFAEGTGVSGSGWDGLSESAGFAPFVPDGLTGWEVSIQSSAQRKAESDYAQRTAETPAEERARTTYVEVICRPWTGARRFSEDKSATNAWREVRGYNVNHLVAWLELAPTTTLWFNGQLGRQFEGIERIEKLWVAWKGSSEPPLGPEIVLAGRASAVEKLRARLDGPPGLTTIGGEVRLREIEAFLGAVWDQQVTPPDGFDRDLIVVSGERALRDVTQAEAETVVLLRDPSLVRLIPSRPVQHFLVAMPGVEQVDVSLDPPSSSVIAQTLESSGMEAHPAAELGQLGRRSLLALQRRLAVNPNALRPTWAAPGAPPSVRRLLLLTAWHDGRAADRAMVERLLDLPYSAIDQTLRELTTGEDDPLLAVVDERWHVVSPMDAWLLLGAQVTRDDAETFARIALEVLPTPDPLLLVPPDERWRGLPEGETPGFSSELREGLARTLAVMAAAGDIVDLGRGTTGASFAAGVVRELLELANRDRTFLTWTSLAPELPLLAEAAPDIALELLREGLQGDEPLLAGMFLDSERDQFGTPYPSPHTHFLWALERLAWSPDYFPAVAGVLSRLAHLDPGGDLANRPLESLTSIFLPWHPNTLTGYEQRARVLTRLRRQFPEEAWDLALSLLPNSGTIQMINPGPAYRDWKPSEPSITTDEYHRAIDDVAGVLLEDVGLSSSRWESVLKRLADFPQGRRRELRELLERTSPNLASEEERGVLWEILRDVISHHREYAEAAWALPSTELLEWDQIQIALEPQDSIRRFGWLFEGGLVTLGDQRRRDDYSAYEAELNRRRTEAVQEIVQTGGLEAVREFASATEVPGIVGAALARAENSPADASILPLLGDEDGPSELAFGYFVERFRREGWAWLDAFLNEATSPVQAARLLRASRYPPGVIDRVDAFDPEVGAIYWQEFAYFGLGHDFEHVSAVAKRLIEAGRPAAALHLMAMYIERTDDQELAETILLAFEALMGRTHPDPELPRLHRHNFQTLLGALSENRLALGRERVIRVEWFFLPGLGHAPEARSLHRELASDPAFFVEVMKMLFKPAGEERQPVTEQERLAAENAYRLLSSWRLSPGVDATGELDGPSLRNWVTQARQMLAAADREAIGDQQIGQVLASSPPDADGSWPGLAVRELLEDLDSDEIDRGFQIAIFNSRGVTSRSPQEGGGQERLLAEEYRAASASFVAEWPRTAAIFRRLAETYDADARREDATAERRRRGID